MGDEEDDETWKRELLLAMIQNCVASGANQLALTPALSLAEFFPDVAKKLGRSPRYLQKLLLKLRKEVMPMLLIV